jgi:hypothetical protein
MKFSKETTSLLKNFASINGNFAIRKGSQLRTISPQRNVFASVTVPEVFDEDFYIYDLSQFLGVLSLFEDPEITFSSTVATIKEGKNSIKYYAADKSVLMLPPEKDVKFPAADAEFTLTAEQLTAIQKTSSVLSAPDLSIIGDGKTISLRVSDLKNSSTNNYEVEIGETDAEFVANISISNLKMINQSYTISLSSKKLSKWVATSGSDMTVYVALENSSTFA